MLKYIKEWIKDYNEWLSTLDINKVMAQYEEAYPKFQYLGANPIDFDQKLIVDLFVYFYYYF